VDYLWTWKADKVASIPKEIAMLEEIDCKNAYWGILSKSAAGWLVQKDP